MISGQPSQLKPSGRLKPEDQEWRFLLIWLDRFEMSEQEEEEFCFPTGHRHFKPHWKYQEGKKDHYK